MRFHDLRHTAGTLAARTGATTKELMARLGHASPQASMIYQHAADDRDRRIAEGLDAMAGEAGSSPPEAASVETPVGESYRRSPWSRTFEAPVTAGVTRQMVDTPCNLRGMESSGDLRVSSRGQMSLPAAARTRWELTDGGEVGYLDLGDALLLVPGGVEALRRCVLSAVTESDWKAAASGFGDPDLADE